MIRNLKVLGLMLVAALAISVMAASAAQAAPNGVLTGGTTPEHEDVTLVGQQTGTAEDNFFETETDKVICTNSGTTFSGTLNGGTEQEGVTTITPSYKECETGSGLAVTVNMNECDYTFTQATKIAANEYTGKADLYCPTGQAITINVYLFRNAHISHSVVVCTLKVRPKSGNEQELGGHVLYRPMEDAEVTSGVFADDITVEANITGVPYTQEGSCGAAEGNSIYKSTVTLGAKDDDTHTEHRDLWVSDEEE